MGASLRLRQKVFFAKKVSGMYADTRGIPLEFAAEDTVVRNIESHAVNQQPPAGMHGIGHIRLFASEFHLAVDGRAIVSDILQMADYILLGGDNKRGVINLVLPDISGHIGRLERTAFLHYHLVFFEIMLARLQLDPRTGHKQKH